MVNLPNIKIIGLTGMSGAGKSTVCGFLAQRDFYIIDCDKIARETAQDRDFLNEIKRRFPENILNAEGFLNREITAKIIFNDDTMLKLYNRIIFPFIVYRIISEIRSSNKDIVLDAPTLFESKLDMICTDTVGVTAHRDVCAERIVLRDKITNEHAYERLSVQHSDEFFKTRCGHIIESSGGLEEVVSQTEKIAEKLKGRI